MERGSMEKKAPVIFLLKCLLFSYIVTAALLLLLAFLLFKLGLTEKIVSIAIIAIYVAATFLAGFLTGKRMGSRRFFMGYVYLFFLVLVAISLAVNHSVKELTDSFLTTMVLCAGGGMLGGMLS